MAGISFAATQGGLDARLSAASGKARAGRHGRETLHSGDAVRGYVRKVTDPSEDDVIFPGEEMEAESAFRLAASHSEGAIPIYVELVEDVEWDSSWGTLTD